MRPIRWTTAAAMLPLLAGGFPPTGDRAEARAADPPPRTKWTTSRLQGSPEPPPPYTTERVFSKLTFDRPGALLQAPGSSRLFVAEIGGKVVSFPNDSNADKLDVAIDLSVNHKPFSALYGIAFHPKFAENRYVYLCYVLGGAAKDGTRVSRFVVSRDDPPKIDEASETRIVDWLAGGHNGGCLFFGNDGYLYISTGDGSGPTPPDQLDTGQDLRDFLSSMLRIDVDGTENGRNYRIPPDNPFRDLPGVRPEIWAYGFRNPWRMSVDRATGDLWVGDVGWELWEMIFRVKRGGNYGWSVTEGPQPVHPEGRRGPTPILPPTTAHPHSEAASITGGYVHHGSRLKELEGLYIYGDYQSGTVWGLRMDGDKVASRVVLAETGLRLGSFGDDAAGEIYLIEVERTNSIHRLVRNPAKPAARGFPKTLAATGLFASTADNTPAPGVLPYRVNAPQWNDGAIAERWIGVPGDGRIAMPEAPAGRRRRRTEGEPLNLKAAEGTVLARTVSIDLEAGNPASRKRVETQVLHFEEGSWRPYTYLWNDAQTDAALVEGGGLDKLFRIKDKSAPGGSRELNYRVAARSECVLCHNPWVEAKTTVFGRQSASPLAFTLPQLAVREEGQDQLDRFAALGLVDKSAGDHDDRLTNPYDPKSPAEERARAYLQVNCAHCHQFNAGGTATILLSAALPLAETKTVDALPTQGTFGIDDARIIAPGEPERSVLYYRIAKTGSGRMPRLGSHRVDDTATRLFADWIGGMPRPAGGSAGRFASDLADAGSADAARSEAGIGRLLGSTAGALALLRAVDEGKVAGESLRRTAAAARRHPKGEVADLFERFLPDAERVRRLGSAWEPAVVLNEPGDAERGRALFFGDSGASCKTCHKVGDQGTSVVGPNLAGVGAKYDRAALLAQIREPSREVATEYLTHVVATKRGEIKSGRLVESNPDRLILLDAQGKTHEIPTSDVDERSTQAKSLMPERALDDLTARQAADLVAYLSSLDVKPAGSK